MAKPASRAQLVDYCLRKLGAPVLEINLDDDQIDDAVDDALQLFQERHFDGVERMYLKYKITQDDIDRGTGKGVDGVGIGGVLEPTNQQSFGREKPSFSKFSAWCFKRNSC